MHERGHVRELQRHPVAPADPALLQHRRRARAAQLDVGEGDRGVLVRDGHPLGPSLGRRHQREGEVAAA